MKRILFCTGEGIGNAIQCLPVIRTLVSNGYTVDFYHMFGTYGIDHRIFPYIDKWINRVDLPKANEYLGLVSTKWTAQHVKWLTGIKQLTEIVDLSMTRSEVDVYMQIARDLGIPEDKLIWEAECDYSDTGETFDVVMSNGYNRKGASGWQIKSYPYYQEVAQALKDAGYSVCSIGGPEEYVSRTTNKTGLTLYDSLGIIQRSQLLISNDTGAYHCANAVKTNNLAIFTATSVAKNYDARFHKYTTVLKTDLKCQPCQLNQKWRRCDDWKCQQLPPEYVFTEAVKRLK